MTTFLHALHRFQRSGFTALLLLVSLYLTASATQADNRPYQSFGEYTVLFTVFNSSFIPPEVASTYNLTRGKGQSLVNVALIKSNTEGNTNGLPAEVSGSVTNLMQQQKKLEFIEISEQDAVYYLAPLRVSSEEVLHFNIEVKHKGKTYPVSFSKKLYAE
ncbi:DUF4426 domain-containing protein [Aestuariicella hydrocarbonica]|uniref:DUF4426 domain-containing protein n=1 Tax=Pseudomaricurvus hydrocarbonicus TaxID=1470433 RepID=A0A9E5MP76_9GAMM|nr:DUF4426 domain-containing protein [Aestuariicella hydrocarbonica]NHO67855.1 DUF4426 domain-containing protein [Aestuariicella hydrocarbonica]